MDEAVPLVETAPGTLIIDRAGSGPPIEHLRHRHAAGQLFVIERGLMVVEAGAGRWMMPPGRLGWLPPFWPHAGRSVGTMQGMVLYLDMARAARLPTVPRVAVLPNFLLALLGRLRDLPAMAEERRGRLLDVLVDDLAELPEEPLLLPMPTDGRLLRMAAALVEDPADPRTLDQWAAEIGLSRRSLTRRMVDETGLPFGRWRTQARLMAAVRLLSCRTSVTEVSLTLGFDSISAFIATFRKHFGTTPARYLPKA
jgi:AraC-like DNA-binding protein